MSILRSAASWLLHTAARSFKKEQLMAFFIFVLAILTVISYTRIALADPNPYNAFRNPLFRDSLGPEKVPKLGAVSSLSNLCSKIGTRVIRKGGNAADAMVATEFCAGVIGMQSTGLGGGGFMLIRASNGSYESVDFRETAPAAAYEQMYAGNSNASLRGGLASAIPGVVRGLEYLHKQYGTLSWSELILPAVRLARDGWTVTPDLITSFEGLFKDSFLTKDPAWALDFAPNGSLVKVGDTMTRKRYANLLEQVAEKGPDAFYTGEIADATIRTIQATNGTMSLEDLKNYSIVRRKPLNITYKDWNIFGCEGPSGGSVVLSVMKIVEDYAGFGSTAGLLLDTHRLDEAIRFGYGARTELGDPSFQSNVSDFEAKILESATAARIRSKISDLQTQPIEAYDPKGIESLETHGTSHVVSADASGMAISLTSTVNTWFGSYVMVPETGLILNNEMNDFSIPDSSNFFGYIASPANYVKAGKRPLSSMAPLIVEHRENRTLYLALGGAGGSHIITAVIQGLWNILDRRMGLAEAVKAPRFHDQLVPNTAVFEYEYDNTTTAFMTDKGHNVTWAARYSDIMALRWLPNRTFEAAAEDLHWVDAGGYAT